ncbi:hypothetical protein A2U01_0105445, partial [Trifolium medium]|nr:hypothetical protein [Trifolium medium]
MRLQPHPAPDPNTTTSAPQHLTTTSSPQHLQPP